MITSLSPRAALAGAAIAFALMAGTASAVTVEINVTNNQSVGGLSLTPFFSAFHNGTFDTFDPGGLASDYVELLAEEGSPAGALDAAARAGATAGVAAAPGGFEGAPVIEPGETATLRLQVNASQDRFLSILSMVIPSNDLFVGNSNPEAHEIFDASGNFVGTDIEIGTANVYDAGTEDNTNLGAAFNTAGGEATDTSNPIALVGGDLDFLLGEGTPIGAVTGINTSLATVSIAAVPLPPAFAMMLAGLGLLGWTARRRTA